MDKQFKDEELQKLQLPEPIKHSLKVLCHDLISQSKNNLRGILLYGGLARNRYRETQSDINLIIILEDSTPSSLGEIAQVLRQGWRQILVEPFILQAREIPTIIKIFPTKFLDIQKHHILLLGDDPFLEHQIHPEEVRKRIEQELWNLALRLRRQYIVSFDDSLSVRAVLKETVIPLKVAFESLLQLACKEDPSLRTTAEVFTHAATIFGLDKECLLLISEIRHQATHDTNNAELFARVIIVINTTIDIVHRMKE
ncbi:MAG: hypothetical protein HYZ34_10910 [Ignavibacteriae bacterium]|nr:hypothetical protein [Ignavibacteriota bacterium]